MDDPLNVVLSTDRNSYVHGDEIVLTFTDPDPGWILTHICLMEIERRIEGEWIHVGNLGMPRQQGGLTTACILQAESIEADPTYSASTPVDLRFEEGGDYRFGTIVKRADGRAYFSSGFSDLYSNTFTVTE